jgi:hypothetical protein
VDVRREVLLWSVAVGGVLIAFGVVVLALNLTVYSASGFVRTYLDALARQDATAALELAGTAAAGDASDALLVREAMGELDDIETIADRTAADGTHYVTARYLIAGETSTTEFAVERSGTLFGLFNGWSFAQSPLSVLQLTVQHEGDFTANGVDLVSEVGQDAEGLYLAFTPSAIELTHESEYLTADPVVARLLQPGTAVPAALDIRANQAFVDEVQRQVDEFLTECTTQPVLLPTGCPFGETIPNRIVSAPVWSMVELPKMTIEPSGEVATWRVQRTPGVAHLVVDVQSLFDGSVSTTDEDVSFDVAYNVTILPDDLLIQADYGP